MKNYKILVDSRRKINSGVGRVSQWIANNISEMDIENAEIFFLVNPDSFSKDYLIPTNYIVETNIKPFSIKEYLELPDYLSNYDFDLYINPQLSWNYTLRIPTINMIHDLWPIKNPEWLPSAKDLMVRFEINDILYFEKTSQFLNDKNIEKYLTSYGIKQWEKAIHTNNIILLGCWAQAAAVTALSRKIVVVSEFIKSEVEKYFNHTNNIVTIYNIPSKIHLAEHKSYQHFLTISKLEKRKNLDFLLDSYTEYVNSYNGNVLPLIIVGDRGYKSVSEPFINRINHLKNVGHKITFVSSISDQELKELFMNSAALIFPSRFEGFGLPPLEAMLSSVPVIATPTGMMATKLGEYAILIDGENTNDLVFHLKNISNGNYPSKLIINQAKEAVIQFINESETIQRWEKTIKSCLF